MKPFEEYKPSLKYPTTIHNIVKPKLVDYNNHTEHGIAMDEWERNISHYDRTRPKIIDEFNRETIRLNNLFMDDLLDDFGWLHLSGKQRKVISHYLWEYADNDFKAIYEKAEEIADVIYVLIEDE